jgi:AcrR family transcriptional regulator
LSAGAVAAIPQNPALKGFDHQERVGVRRTMVPDRKEGKGQQAQSGATQMGLRERKKLMRLQRIIAAARKLFIEKGFNATTIQDIADEADVGLGTLYLYAKSKEDLLVLVFKEYIIQMIETSYASVPAGEPLLDQLMAFFEGHIQYHKSDIVMSRTVLKELSFSHTPQRKEDIDEIMSSTFSRLGDIVEKAIKEKRTSKHLYAGTATWSIFALYYHLLQSFLCGFLNEDQFRKDLRNALDMLLS